MSFLDINHDGFAVRCDSIGKLGPIYSSLFLKAQNIELRTYSITRTFHNMSLFVVDFSSGPFKSRPSGVARGSKPLAGVRGVPAKTPFSCFSFVASGDKRKTGPEGQSLSTFKCP